MKCNPSTFLEGLRHLSIDLPLHIFLPAVVILLWALLENILTYQYMQLEMQNFSNKVRLSWFQIKRSSLEVLKSEVKVS